MNEPMTPEQVEAALDEFPAVVKPRLRARAHAVMARLRDLDVEALASKVYRRRIKRIDINSTNEG